MPRVLAIAALSLAATVACSATSEPTPESAGGGGSTSTSGGAGGTTTSGGSGGTAPGACTKNDFSATSEFAELYAMDEYLYYEGASANAYPADAVSIELFHAFGADSGAHSHTFTDINYDSCHTCALLYENCTSDVACDRYFLVVEGTLDVTAQGVVGEQITGTLTNVKAIEVTLDDVTFATTPVPDGDVWCVDSYAFDATIAAGPP